MPFSWPDFSIINGPLSLKYGRHQNFLSSVKMQNVLPYFKESSTPPHRRYILMKGRRRKNKTKTEKRERKNEEEKTEKRAPLPHRRYIAINEKQNRNLKLNSFEYEIEDGAQKGN